MHKLIDEVAADRSRDLHWSFSPIYVCAYAHLTTGSKSRLYNYMDHPILSIPVEFPIGTSSLSRLLNQNHNDPHNSAIAPIILPVSIGVKTSPALLT